MRTIKKKGLAAIAVGALAVGLLIPAGSAQADTAASGSDIVGVGSDTLQYMLDFGDDGDFNGNPGYNTGHLQRAFSYDATPDANARAGYLNGSTNATLLPLQPTVVLRAGNAPVQRPNGSGSGIAAITNDNTTGSSEKINFVRSSAPISQAQANALPTGMVLHEVLLAEDNIQILTASTTNAPATGLTSAQLKNIYMCNPGYTTWNGTGLGNGTGSTDTIVPVIPQSGSGTRSTFLGDIGITGNPGSCVRTDEENNPYALFFSGDSVNGTPVADPYSTTAVANPDALVPFATGRLNMYTAGYFKNPTLGFGVPAPAGDQLTLHPAVSLQQAATAYTLKRGLYVLFRQSDVTSTTHFNGSSQNWVQNLFLNTTNATDAWYDSSGQADLASAGVTPTWADCGTTATGGGAVGGANCPLP